MKILNRGFLIIKPKQAYWNWANQFDEDMSFTEEDECEGTVYLIEEDFFEFEPIIEKNFKKILKNEFTSVADENFWPENLTIELFHEWFDYDFGSSVFDTLKTDLETEKVD
ncbi:MAG: hypothetical protein V4622_11370 [Bacteroidota bacterium]